MAIMLQASDWQAKLRAIPRTNRRASVSLPALVRLFGKQFSARVHNLSSGGALIETSAPLHAGAEITLSCGTIESPAAVVWDREERFGLKFADPINEEQVVQQLYRSEAAEDRRRLREAATSRN